MRPLRIINFNINSKLLKIMKEKLEELIQLTMTATKAGKAMVDDIASNKKEEIALLAWREVYSLKMEILAELEGES